MLPDVKQKKQGGRKQKGWQQEGCMKFGSRKVASKKVSRRNYVRRKACSRKVGSRCKIAKLQLHIQVGCAWVWGYTQLTVYSVQCTVYSEVYSKVYTVWRQCVQDAEGSFTVAEGEYLPLPILVYCHCHSGQNFQWHRFTISPGKGEMSLRGLIS